MQHQDRTSRVSHPAPTTLHDRDPVTPDPEVSGTVLGGRYRVGECIGAGAMGVVWTAWDRRLRRTVAVKQLTPPRDDDPSAARTARARAMREGRIAARVVHPRAIAVFDVVMHRVPDAEPVPWLVMEYLPSRSLAAVLAEHGPLAPGAVARIGAQIAEALSAVHEAGIVHGDVKPGNVLITDDGVAKLTDFGVSRASWDTSSTGSDLVAGTPGYFAPEVARGGDPTSASDVFSLGATLYAAVENELVCGALDNTLAVLHAMAEGRLRPATRAGVLGRPLASMLRLDPERRPDTAALRAVLENRAAPPGPLVPTTAAGAAAPAPPATLTAAAGASVSDDDRAGPHPGETPDDRGDGAGSVRGAAVAAAPPVAAVLPGTAAGPATTPPGPATPTLGTPVTRSGRERRTRRRRALAVAAVGAVVLSAGVGAAVAAVDRSAAPPTVEAAPAAPASTVPETTRPATPDPLPPVAADPVSPVPSTPDADPDDPVTSDDVRDTVQAYYGLLPGDIDGAWVYLAPDARAASGGYDGYRGFWSGIDAVRANDVTVEGTRARAVIEFTTSGGRTTREPYSFEVARDSDGRLQIVSASQGSDTSA